MKSEEIRNCATCKHSWSYSEGGNDICDTCYTPDFENWKSIKGSEELKEQALILDSIKPRFTIDCSKCGTYAVTLNKKTCISIRSGKVCKGKISKVQLPIIKRYKFMESELNEYTQSIIDEKLPSEIEKILKRIEIICTDCGAKLTYGLSDKLKSIMQNSKLLKRI